jgi:hypothetical protein
MPNIDAFSAQIVKLVREMPDEAILDLVKHQLGALKISRPQAARRRPAKEGRAAPRKAAAKPKGKREVSAAGNSRPGRPRRPIAVSAERQVMLDEVERLVKQSSGLSASDVAKSAGIPQTRAAAALKELKLAKRIFQGGDRRFARYAGDAKAADQASAIARKNATGPAVPSAKGAPRSRKRAQPATAAGAGAAK